MLTIPKIVTRGAKRYLAIRQSVSIPFGKAIDKVMPKVGRWFEQQGIETGPAIFKYNRIDMPSLDMEFGFLTAKSLTPDGEIEAGVLPAGRYVTPTHFGHYRHLRDATAVLLGWAKISGLELDMRKTKKGELFASRFELYPNGPMDEPDSDKWETQLFMKLKE
ncbi:MAG: GyrI-like domain-containing protein [Devosia sp.]